MSLTYNSDCVLEWQTRHKLCIPMRISAEPPFKLNSPDKWFLTQILQITIRCLKRRSPRKDPMSSFLYCYLKSYNTILCEDFKSSFLSSNESIASVIKHISVCCCYYCSRLCCYCCFLCCRCHWSSGAAVAAAIAAPLIFI